MANYHLTSGRDTIAGESGNDTIYAFIERPSLEATLQPSDSINGGGGTDTLIVDLDRVEKYNSTAQRFETVFLNYSFGSINAVERLVLTGRITSDEEASAAPIDVSKLAGLKEISFRSSSTYDQTEPGSATDISLKNVSGQMISVDGSYSDPQVDYGADLDIRYKASAKKAEFTLTDAAFATLALEGSGLTTLSIRATGKGTAVANPVTGNGADTPDLKTFEITTSATASFVWLAGFVETLSRILTEVAGFEPDPLPNHGIPGLKKVTVSGSGDSLVDLTDNKAAVTFTGGKGNDGVLVTPANTTAKDHFDGGEGHDVFGISLADLPKSKTTLTPTKAEFAILNEAARNFEVFGVMGDFQRTIVIDVRQVKVADEILVGQSARIGNITDDHQIDFQTTGLDEFLPDARLTLLHATNSTGALLGKGVVELFGGDVLGAGGFLLKSLGAETLTGTARLDDGSLYAKLVLSGAFDLEVESARAWKDAAGRLNGVTIDASALIGKVKAQGTDQADTLVGGRGRDTLGGGRGADHFVFDAKVSPGNADVITDFAHGVDDVWLDHVAFNRAGMVGELSAGAFHVSLKNVAGDSNDRIIYNSKTGDLFYDPDGTSAEKAIIFAHFGEDKHPSLSASDFLIV